jgi:hypothetical protein
MVPRTFRLGAFVVCAAAGPIACAAEQVDDMPQDSGGTGATAGATAGSTGSGGTTAATAGSNSSSGSPASGGTGSCTAGTAGVAGSAQGGKGGSTGTAGTGAGGGPPKPVNTNLPFSRDFEDGDMSAFIPWNEDMTAGMWTVVADGAGKVFQPAGTVGELEFAVGGSSSWTDVAFSVKVRLNNDESEAQIATRFKIDKTYLVVEMAVGKFKLRGRSDGSSLDLVTPSPKPDIVPGTWYTVGVTAKGTSVTLTLDGQVIGTPAMAAAAISAGGIGLGVAEGSVSYDDVKVEAAP